MKEFERDVLATLRASKPNVLEAIRTSRKDIMDGLKGKAVVQEIEDLKQIAADVAKQYLA
jgi:hypothetical protein